MRILIQACISLSIPPAAVVANAWLETLLDVVDLLPREVVRDEVLSVAVAKGQAPAVPARLAACKLIGKIATKFEPFL